MKNRTIVALWIALIIMLGCSTQQIFGDVLDETTDRIGEEIASRVVNAYLGDIGPRLIRSYTVGLMQVMFYQGGYGGDALAYEPGEYTVWSSEDSPYGETFERSFLQRRDDGWEWWRVEIYGEDPDTDDEVHMILEALFEPRQDQRYIRELHVLYPDDDQPQEVEIREEDAEAWVIRAEEWNEEQRSELLVGTEEVVVPAGRFQANHYRSEAVDQEGVRTDWWTADGQVPGSVLKVRQTDMESDDAFQTMVLETHGDDAGPSLLDAF